MKRAFAMCVALAVAAGCGGPPKAPDWYGPTGDEVTPDLMKAVHEEAVGDPAKAEEMYVDLIEQSIYSSPWELAAVEASMDALVTREVRGLDEFSDRTALVYRLHDREMRGDDEPDLITKRMPRIFHVQNDTIKKGIIAHGLMQIAEKHGNWAEAERWRAATGCAREVTILGPTTWASVTTVRDAAPTPLDAYDAPLPATYTTTGPFGTKEAPYVYTGHGCSIDLAATSRRTGVRTVVYDVDIRRPMTIGVGLRAHGQASLRVGGLLAITQPYELGAEQAARFATVDVPAGRLRLVAEVGMDEDGETLELDAFTDEGDSLVAHAPKPGERATSRATAVKRMELPTPKTDAQRTTLALAALATGDARTAERLLENVAKEPKPMPEAMLAYARAVESAADISNVHRAERARAAYERVLDAWPGSWEAVLAHGVLAGVRRGESDARLETLKDVEAHRAKVSTSGQALIDAFEAATNGRERLYGPAADAFARAKTSLDKTALLRDAEHVAFTRSDDDAATFACASSPPTNDRSSFDCFTALHTKGDLAGAARELDRIRALYGAPARFAPLAVRDALTRGDLAHARAEAALLAPGEWTLSNAMQLTTGPDGKPAAPDVLRSRLIGMAPIARDSPNGLATLLGSLEGDGAASLDKNAAQLAAEDRAHPLMAGAATAVLEHTEHYDVSDRGVVHFTMFDLRRVNGTTDVDTNAQADPPGIDGRVAFRVLRKRIFKKDGRVLEPESAPNAAQSHADLAQLEQGDTVEAVYEGWAIPGETGDIGIDTPDLLPERTAVAQASIEIRLPESIKVSMWSHPLLGKATESRAGGVRTLSWSMSKQGTRHVEYGTPKMDRTVSVSLSTAVWPTVALALRETEAALVEHDPEVTSWAYEAANVKPGTTPKPTVALVDAVVRAAGETVHEASPAVLSDIGAGGARGPQTMNARTILTEHEGSRTWLVTRALRELGVKVDVVVAENEPFSADPNFPPHFGRFLHPLAIAHVTDDKGAAKDLWIDADVPGPPLPPGHVSPELRGRTTMREDGTMGHVDVVANDEQDEIDIRLALDEAGNAKGDVTALLHGRAAQEIAEALTRVVGFERERTLRDVVLGWVPYANVNDVALSSSEGSWQIAVRASISVSGYAQVEAGTNGAKTWVLPGIDPVHWVFPRPGVASLTSTYAAEGSRQSALAVSHAVQYHAHRRVELPPGAKVAKLPGPFEAKTVSLGASRSISVAGSVIEESFLLSVPTGTIAPNDYPEFARNAQRTDDAFLASTRVTPK